MTLPRLAPLLYLLVVFSVAVSCKQQKPPVITRAYYYWRNSTSLSSEEIVFLRQHAVRKVYAKCLDIDWNDIHYAYPLTITPVHKIAYAFKHYSSDTLNATVVPVVFITNKTFQRIDSTEIPLLATHILRKCLPNFDSLGVTNRQYSLPYSQPVEIQFDCDWSVGTKNKYFYFLREVKRQLGTRNILLSATIRLHQYKYPSMTGVPPVNRGMLMVYNINKLTEYTVTNSIFDYTKAKAYFTSRQPYPLKLDMALPAYAWGIVFRQGQFYQIENSLTEDMLRKSAFLQHSRQNFYKVTADTVFYDMYLRPGDEIKIEQVNASTLLQAAALAGKAINTDSFSISLFELSQHEITNYSHETIEQVYNGFSR
jgi:hypothetical protein